jgi:hypothetical protein
LDKESLLDLPLISSIDIDGSAAMYPLVRRNLILEADNTYGLLKRPVCSLQNFDGLAETTAQSMFFTDLMISIFWIWISWP